MNTKSFAVGIDIGGTKMAAAVMDQSGELLARSNLPTDAASGFERAVENLGRTVENLLGRARVSPRHLAGIGVGCAGPVDPARGLINNPYTLTGWDQCDIVSPLHRRFGVPVYLENDADAAAIGECFCGAGRGANPVVMLTFGTGVGGGIVVNEEIYRGVRGEHPELGHIPVDPNGPACYCGLRGCLESLASGTGITAAGREHGWTEARQIFISARQGRLAALRIVERAADAAATAAWTIAHTLLPERLVIGGGIMDDHFERFATAMSSRLDPATQFTRKHVSVVRAALGNDAGIVGAAAIALRRCGKATPAAA